MTRTPDAVARYTRALARHAKAGNVVAFAAVGLTPAGVPVVTFATDGARKMALLGAVTRLRDDVSGALGDRKPPPSLHQRNQSAARRARQLRQAGK